MTKAKTPAVRATKKRAARKAAARKPAAKKTWKVSKGAVKNPNYGIIKTKPAKKGS